MSTPKKAIAKTGTHNPARDRAGAPRHHYLVTTVTKKEKDAILKYCERHNKSVSAFLADLALADAHKSNSKRQQEEITVTLKLPARDLDQMRSFARLEDKSLEDLVRELLQPSFQKRQTATALEMHTLRCWLSNEEHRIIKKYLAKHRLSARSYLALLALKVINNQ
ncbi:MAG TPA: hypothetical protein VFR24_26740 [Candidatus Angelobacter sp.]|nr:hypothetical protein [Candidatus Angelobacter sp.]